MAKSLYRPNRKGVAELAASADIQNGMVRAAEIVKAAAESTPVLRRGTNAQRRGYAASFKVVPNKAKVRGGVGARPRGAAMVINDHEMERLFGGRSRTLYRALDALNGVTIQ